MSPNYLAKSKEHNKNGVFFIELDEIPRAFHNTKFRDIVYLDKPVCAITSRLYLESVSPTLTLSSLFQERGEFFPFNPEYIKEV